MKYSFWFMADSQFLYGSEVLEAVEARAKEMPTEVSMVLFYPFISKVIAKTNQGILGMVVMSPDIDVDARIMVRAT